MRLLVVEDDIPIQLFLNRALTEAQALYRAEGYREVARFGDNPYAHHWFAKEL